MRLLFRAFLFNRFAHSAGPFYLGCLRGGLLGCCLWVCLYVRSSVGLLAHISGACPGGLLGSILGARGVAWSPFSGLWALLGSILGFWEAPLNSMFGALGLLWCLWGSLRAPLAAQGGQNEIFLLFSSPFWGHFGTMLEVKNDEKYDMVPDCFVY